MAVRQLPVLFGSDVNRKSMAVLAPPTYLQASETLLKTGEMLAWLPAQSVKMLVAHDLAGMLDLLPCNLTVLFSITL